MTDIIERLRIESRREPHEPIWRDAIDEIEALRKALKELITWVPSEDVYRRLGFDPEAPMKAYNAAKALLSKEAKHALHECV